MNFKNYFLIIAGSFLFLFLGLSACSRQAQKEHTQMTTVQSQSLTNTLFYTGIIQPLRTVVVPSPADGVVIDMPFQYGESVKAGQLLFMLSSTKFLTDYKAALMQYIKAKNDFNNSQTQLAEGKFLHKNLLISDDDYKTKQSNYYAAQLALVQAKDSLKTFLQQLDIKKINLYDLTIADIDKITQAMHLQTASENLRVFAPASGTVLSPSKSDDENKKTFKGDTVKQGDLLAIIGDMDGLTVRIKVNELTINQLKVGQKVRVSGIAFPEHTLLGEIGEVDRQGEPSTSGLPTFSIVVMVKKLSAEQQKQIHAGMSAKVEIDIEEEPRIAVPIVALREKNGEFYVKLYDEKTKKIHEQLVKTGKTTAETVAILSGLKAGDKIVSN